MKILQTLAVAALALAAISCSGGQTAREAAKARQDSIRQDSLRREALLANPATRDSVLAATVFKGTFRANNCELGDVKIDLYETSIKTKADSGKEVVTRADIQGWVMMDEEVTYEGATATFWIVSDFYNGRKQQVKLAYDDGRYTLYLLGEQTCKEDLLTKPLPTEISLRRID